MEGGDDPDFNNMHGEAPFEYYARVRANRRGSCDAERCLKGAGAMDARGSAGIGKTKHAGEACAYAKRLIGEG